MKTKLKKNKFFHPGMCVVTMVTGLRIHVEKEVLVSQRHVFEMTDVSTILNSLS